MAFYSERPVERRAWRRAWADPVRKVRTLESFARTEEDGGVEIAEAARATTNARLRVHLERHAADEVRHAELFRTRAAELRASGGAEVDRTAADDRATDLERARGLPALHGHLVDVALDEASEVEFIAKLHVAEVRAAEVFAVHRDLIGDDPKTSALFDRILVDEKYHVGYTRTFLDQWRASGRAGEVDRALSAARGRRLMESWRQLGLRSGTHFGRAVLVVLYFTLCAPFALVLRRQRPARGWRAPRTTAVLDELGRQA